MSVLYFFFLLFNIFWDWWLDLNESNFLLLSVFVGLLKKGRTKDIDKAMFDFIK